jgi:hypothetical protein
MRFLFISFLLIPSMLQSQQLSVRIDSIATDDSNSKERKFTIYYNISNLSDEKISFFLKPDALTNSVRSSGTNTPCYIIYSEDEVMNVSGILRTKINAEDEVTEIKREHEKNLKKIMAAPKDSIDEYIQKNTSDRLLQDIFSLNPKEVKKISHVFSWNKERYHKLDDHEYYIDENKRHYIKIFVTLPKEQYKDQLMAAEFEKIMTDPNFIKGAFVSNKMEINFNEIKNPDN